MTGSVTLRPAGPDDDEFLRAVYASTRSDELNLSGWDDHQKRAFIELQFRAQSQQYLMCYPEADNAIIQLNELPVGRLLVDRKGTDFMLVDIALLPDYRKAGIGTALIQSLLDEATSSQKSVGLHVLRWNVAARLYERLGFKITGDDGVYFEMKRVPDEPCITAG
jgi:ribosomal protein S18 acetylase RimI-like enzyme